MSLIYNFIKMEIINTIIWFILWLISSLFVFFITEKIKKIKDNKIKFLKLSSSLRQLLMLIISLESSCKQYIEANKYSLKEIGSIWFPDYKFTSINDIIPYELYNKNEKYFLNQLNQVERITFSLNNLIKDLAINEIKEDLLSKRVSLEESESRYKNELKFIENQLNQIPNYIVYIFQILSKINLINRYNVDSILHLNTKFSDIEIENEYKNLEKEFYISFNKTEDFKV